MVEEQLRETVGFDRSTNTKTMGRFLKDRWTAGGLISFAFIWAVSALFGDGAEPYSYDKTADSWIIMPGATISHRTEGWGRSYFGNLGIGSVPNVSDERRRVILLWGDSYVEALQVNDAQKMAQQLTELFQEHGQDRLCAGRGMSGDNLADYVSAIPAYEKQVPSIDHHIIFISSPDDILPDRADDTRVVFQSTAHGYELRRTSPEYHLQNVKHLTNTLRLHFAWPLLKSLTQGPSLRFSPGPVKAKPNSQARSEDACPSEAHLQEAWDFLVRRIREKTCKSVTVVYAPHVPRIAGNRVACDDPDWPLVGRFAAICRSHGIDFVNMHDLFLSHYRATGEFPRGFPNSRPGDGHLNAVGHRLIAEALFGHLEDDGL